MAITPALGPPACPANQPPPIATEPVTACHISHPPPEVVPHDSNGVTDTPPLVVRHVQFENADDDSTIVVFDLVTYNIYNNESADYYWRRHINHINKIYLSCVQYSLTLAGTNLF